MYDDSRRKLIQHARDLFFLHRDENNRAVSNRADLISPSRSNFGDKPLNAAQAIINEVLRNATRHHPLVAIRISNKSVKALRCRPLSDPLESPKPRISPRKFNHATRRRAIPGPFRNVTRGLISCQSIYLQNTRTLDRR